MIRIITQRCLLSLFGIGFICCHVQGQEIAAPRFEADVMPLLRQNCVACHNQKTAEGGLNLESVGGILAGGDSGEMVSLESPHESLLLVRARGEVDSIMPPEDNSVGARPLTDAEMLLVERWIAAGAKEDSGPVATMAKVKPSWNPLPDNLRSIYSLAPSPVRTTLAIGRGNSILIVDSNSGEVLSELIDDEIQATHGSGVAHLDFVNALGFSPDGNRLASGGYRTLKLWRRNVRPQDLGNATVLVRSLVLSAAKQQGVNASEEQLQQINEWWKKGEGGGGKSADELELLTWQNDLRREVGKGEFLNGLVAPATERVTKEEEAKKKAEEAHAKQVEDLTAKKAKVDEVVAKLKTAEEAETPPTEEQKAAIEKEIGEAKGSVEAAEKSVAAAAQALASANDVHLRSIESLNDLNAEIEAGGKARDAIQAAIAERSSLVEQKTITCAGFSADSKRAAAAISDGTVVVFDAETGRMIERLEGLPTGVNRLRFQDPWLLAFADSADDVAANETFAAWNLEGGWKLEKVIGSPDGESPFVDRVTALDFSPDGKHLIVGGGEPSRTGVMTVFDTSSFEVVANWDKNHSDIVLALRVSPDGKHLASTGADKQIRIVDFPSGDNLRVLEGHTHHVLGLAWQDHGRRLASASADKTVKVWNVRAGEAERTIAGGSKELSGISFIGTTPQVAVSSGEGSVKIYNTDNGSQVRGLNNVQGFQQTVAADPKGEWIAAGSADGSVRVWPTEAVEPKVVLD